MGVDPRVMLTVIKAGDSRESGDNDESSTIW